MYLIQVIDINAKIYNYNNMNRTLIYEAWKDSQLIFHNVIDFPEEKNRDSGKDTSSTVSWIYPQGSN